MLTSIPFPSKTIRRLAVLFFSVLFVLLLMNLPVYAADGQVPLAFNDGEGEVSHIYWPFPPQPDPNRPQWALRGYGHGEGTHTLADYYAEDWGLPGQTDCGKAFYAPFAGEIIYRGNARNGYGRQIVLQSRDNPEFAFRIAHLRNFARGTALGTQVSTGDMLGRVGRSGGMRYCHAHIVLYKGLDAIMIENLKEGGRPSLSKNQAAEFALDANYTDQCADHEYRESLFSNQNLKGDPDMVWCVSKIRYNWGLGKIRGLDIRDHFSARWERSVVLRTGRYRFVTRANDGVRLWVGGELLIDRWENSRKWMTFNRVDTELDSSLYYFKLEYFENVGLASMNFNYRLLELLNNPPIIIPPIPDQTISIGESFTPIDLDLHGYDPDLFDEITWEVSGQSQLDVDIDEDNVVTITPPPDIALSETLTFTLTDNFDPPMSASTTATFEVVAPTCDITVRSGDVGQFVLAIDEANSNPDATVICLTPGTPYYFGTIHNTIYGASGVGVIGTPITIIGNGARLERDLGPNVVMRFFAVAGVNAKLTLLDMTLAEGSNNILPTPGWGGGSIYNNEGTVILNNIQFLNSRSNYQGGAILNRNGTTEIRNCEFIQSEVSNQGSGGAISNNKYGTVIIEDTTFFGSSAANVGGAIYTRGNLTMEDVEMAGNYAFNGGGAIFQYEGVSNISNSKFTGNIVDRMVAGSGTATGGAISNNSPGILNLSNVQLYDNIASLSGSAIWSNGTSNVHQSCIVGNNNTAVMNDSGPTVDAIDNWWGAADGPGGAGGGSGDAISTGVDFAPFLTIKPSYCEK